MRSRHEVSKILFNVEERSFKIRIVIFVGNTPTERTEFLSFDND